MKHSFTLLELLVVIVIAAVLFGLLANSHIHATRRATGISCLSHMRIYGVATSMYADANNGYFPDVRTYLTPESKFPSYFGSHRSLIEKQVRCPGDDSTISMNRAGMYQGLMPVTIGGTANLSDSLAQTPNGPSYIAQSRDMPQNKYPERRCLWADYQNQEADKTITGARLDIWEGTTESNSLHQYVFRHPGNSANGTFADGHGSYLKLMPGIKTANNGHDLAKGQMWILPADNTYPYGPTKLNSTDDSPQKADSLKDTPSIKYSGRVTP